MGISLPLFKFYCLSKDANRTRKSLLLVLVHEALNTPFGVHELGFARKERMAHGADFHFDISFRGAGMNHASASAADGRFQVFRVQLLLHKTLP
jgi:hypothetical protein